MPAKSSISARVVPERRSIRSQSVASIRARSSSKPVVRSATNSSSIQPPAISAFSAPARKPASPPVWRPKKRSVIFVPKRALSAFDGIQYRSIPGSRYGLTITTLVPAFFARWRYLALTGWLFAGFEPMNTIRSVPIQSL